MARSLSLLQDVVPNLFTLEDGEAVNDSFRDFLDPFVDPAGPYLLLNHLFGVSHWTMLSPVISFLRRISISTAESCHSLPTGCVVLWMHDVVVIVYSFD